MYPPQDFSKKMVVVMNKGARPWLALNGLAHASAYLGNKMPGAFDTGGNFTTSDGVQYPKNSQYPLIMLQAKPGQMANLIQKVRQSGLLYMAFISGMPDCTDDIEVQKIVGSKQDTELELYAIGLFGEHQAVNALTKRYRLWQP